MIDSPSNPTVRALRDLSTGKGRHAAGQFLVEGVRGIEDGLRSGAKPKLVLYNSDLLARTERGNNLLAALSRQVPGKVFEASERALKAAGQTEHPQGILASFAIPEWSWSSMASERCLALVCDGISDPGNLGTLLRSAEAAGADLVVASKGCVDLYNPKVVRAAMGAHFRLPSLQDLSWEEIVRGLSQKGVGTRRIFCTDASAERDYDDLDWTQASAIIVSNETHGLSAAARSVCARGGGAVRIPMLGGSESLNAAVAGSLIMFEAARQRRQHEREG
jgi:RNA methyltransferase, TrmH family